MGAGEGHPCWYQLLHAARCMATCCLPASPTASERCMRAPKLLPVPSAAKGSHALTRPPGPRHCAAWGAGRRLLPLAASSQDGRMCGSCGPRTSAARSSTSGRSLRRRLQAARDGRERRALSMGEARRRRRPVVRPRSFREQRCVRARRLRRWKSPFASGTLVLMHNGSARAAVLAAPPPTVPGLRRGGTDAANAATWRLTSSPLGMAPPAEGGPPHLPRGVRLARQRADRRL